jgi:hypothetical protein
MGTHTSTFANASRQLLWGLLLYASLPVLAQNTVMITPVITPPYSPYLYSYQDQLLVNLTNTTGQSLSVKIIGAIEGDNGYAVRTKAVYQPPSPIVLGPYETRVLQGNNALLDFLDPPNVDLIAPQSIQSMVAQTGQLPEGNYSLCVRAVEYTTGTPLSAEAPSGCIFFPITSATPPLFTSPLCEDSITTPWPIFTWTPAVGMLAGADIRYDLFLVKLLPGQNAVEAMNQAMDYQANNPVIRRGLMVPNYTWQPYDPVLATNAWYAAAVVATDLNNQVVIQNNGRSEVCTFLLKNALVQPTTTASNPQVTVQIMDSLPPLPNARIQGRLLYAFKEAEVINMSDQQYNTSGGLVDVPITAPGGAMSDGGGTGILNAGAQTDYQASGTFIDAYLGGSTTGNTWYNAAQPDQYVIGGQASDALFGGLGFPTEKWVDPFPVSSSKARPLKNMEVRLVERTVMEGVVITKGNEELARLETMVLGVDEPAVLQGTTQSTETDLEPTSLDEYNYRQDSVQSGRVLQVFTTGEDGQFTVNYHQLAPTAYQKFNVTTNAFRFTLGVDKFSGATSANYVYQCSVHADRSYRVLMLEVVSPYYCSPDLRILAQPGDDLELPDATVYVHSYNLRAAVHTDASHFQTAMGPLPNMQVQVTRPEDQHPWDIPENEGQDLGGGPSLPGGSDKLVGRGITNSKGETVIKNLVRHTTDAPNAYLVQVQSNDSAGSVTYYCAAKSYWEPAFQGSSEAAPYIGKRWMPSANAFVGSPRLNSQFKLEEFRLEFTASPELPRVIGRVMASSIEAVPGAKVSLLLSYKDPSGGAETALPPMTMYSDAQGYFEFNSIPVLVQNGKFFGPYAALQVNKAGFKQALRPGTGKQQLLYGFQWDLTAGIQLEPLGHVTGTVVDEEGRPVKSDIKCGDAPRVRTETKIIPGGSQETGPGGNLWMMLYTAVEAFDAPSPSGMAVPILVEPLSDKYFPATHTRSISGTAQQDIGKLVVKEKLHRLKVVVHNMGHEAVAGAQVTLGDISGTTQGNGEVHFRFASKDNEFRLKVRPPDQLVPLDTLIINEVSPDWTVLTVQLGYGAKLVGTVREKGTGTTVPGARVWVELGNDAYGPILLETASGADGQFTLNGVPLDAQEVHATKQEAGVGWVGDTKTISLSYQAIPNPIPGQGSLLFFNSVTMELQRVADMDLGTLLGFPIEVEQYQANSDGTATISGAFVQLAANGNFALADPATRLPFSQVKIQKGAAGPNGLPMAEPVGNMVPTNVPQLALKLYGNHDMTLQGMALFGGVTVARNNGAGVIRGLVSTELSTFKFTYDFNGRFYLGEGPDELSITAFNSGATLAKRNYNLMDIGYQQMGNWYVAIPQPKDIAFDLRGFDAHADRARSYVTTDTFSLRTLLRIHDIPQLSPSELTIDVGAVKVMNADIIGLQGGGEALSFNIGQWQLKSTTPWSFNNDLGCITVPKAKLITGKADADVENLLLWPNNIDLDATQLGEVRLGGIVPLKASNNTPWEFGYSQAEGAWVLGKMSATSVLYFSSVPNMSPDRVDLSVFRLLSNGQMKAGVVESDHVLDGIMDFHLNGIDPGTDNVQLLGIPYLHIPNFPANQSARFLVSRQGSQLLGGLAPIWPTIHTLGNVDFTFRSLQTLSPGKFTANGILRVKDEQQNKTIELVGLLTHTKSGTKIDVIKTNGGEQPGVLAQEVHLDKGQSMLVRDGQQQVAGGQWQELWFDANMNGCKAINADQPPVHFVVSGAIQANAGKIQMDQIDTPFGGMTITYDFNKQLLVGSMTMNHFPTGPLVINQATMGLIIGGGGLALYCGDADASVAILPEPINHVQPGFVIGAHSGLPPEVITSVMSHARNKSLPPQLASNRVNGLFYTANKPILEVDLPGIDLEVVSADGYLKTGLDTRFWLDLEEGYHTGGLAYFDFKYGVDATLCSLCLALLMELQVESSITASGEFNATGCGVASISGSLCGVNVSESVSVRAVISSSDGLSVGLGSGSSCSQQSVPSCN